MRPKPPKLPELTNIELIDNYLARCNYEERVSVETLLSRIEQNYKARHSAAHPFGPWMAKDLLGGLLRWSLLRDSRYF